MKMMRNSMLTIKNGKKNVIKYQMIILMLLLYTLKNVKNGKRKRVNFYEIKKNLIKGLMNYLFHIGTGIKMHQKYTILNC